jgi:hypothetical protein
MEVIQTIKERRSINFFQPGQNLSDEKLSIPKWIGIHHWIVIAIAWAIILLTLMKLEKKKL